MYSFYPESRLLHQQLAGIYDLSDTEVDALNRAIMYNKINVTSDHFRILSRATLEDERKQSLIACIFGVGRGVRYWMEM